jgi:hypothetical protein
MLGENTDNCEGAYWGKASLLKVKLISNLWCNLFFGNRDNNDAGSLSQAKRRSLLT